MEKALIISVVVVGLIVSTVLIRRSIHEEELLDARHQAELEARRHVDLGNLPRLPDPPDKPPEETKPKFKKKPIVVEMLLQQKHAGKVRPFQGHYKLVDASGSVVNEAEAPARGEPAVFILSPGQYEVIVHGGRQVLTLVGSEGDKTRVKVVFGK